MGDKIESKKAAAKAKVSTVHGASWRHRDAKHAVKIADDRLSRDDQASARARGKGMRIAHSTPSRRRIWSGQGEAKASFGDDGSFIREFIVDPRHIESRCRDKHGNVIYLGERELSFSAALKGDRGGASPLLDEALAAKMGEQRRARKA